MATEATDLVEREETLAAIASRQVILTAPLEAALAEHGPEHRVISVTRYTPFGNFLLGWRELEQSFAVRCTYCQGVHTATAGTYHDGAPYNGQTVYGVTDCEVAPTPYGVLRQTDRRVVEQEVTC
jgi:hypothetical protein